MRAKKTPAGRNCTGDNTPLAGVVAGLLLFPASTFAIVSSNSGTSVFSGVNINELVGADRFYANNYWGANAIVANVEAGYIWNAHETLTNRIDHYFCDPAAQQSRTQYDWHATMVGHVLGGRPLSREHVLLSQVQSALHDPSIYSLYEITFNANTSSSFDGSTWYGIAPQAHLWSGAIATSWEPTPEYTGSFNITTQSFFYAYNQAMAIGYNGRKADVINSSWGGDDPTGSGQETKIIDALAYANRTTVVMAAGNGGGQVIGPASGFNGISVSALTGDTSTPVYGALASFSSHGPNDFYNPRAGVTTTGVRAAVDLTAPGDNLTLAFYGGTTGGHVSGTDPVSGSGLYYIQDMAGTSFASPIVAGGAALLVDLGRTRFGDGSAIDGRVIKAVLMNSATKTAGWTNNSILRNGAITTDQSVDWSVGAGMLNLDRAYDQYTSIAAGPISSLAGASVSSTGWDYGTASRDHPQDYLISQQLHKGTTLAATLDWFVNRSVDATSMTASDVQFANLDLQLWRVDGATPSLIAQSDSLYNAIEHLYITVPDDGFYKLRVLWSGEIYDMPGTTPDTESYGLAWLNTAAGVMGEMPTVVPEPAEAGMLILVGMGLMLRRRRRKNPQF